MPAIRGDEIEGSCTWMSLTSLIKTDKEIKAFLLRTMPERETFESSSSSPAFAKMNPAVIPASAESRSAQIGMVTDFLFRYITAKAVGIPMSYEAAKAGIAQMQRSVKKAEISGAYEQVVHFQSMVLAAKTSFEKFRAILDENDALNKDTAPAILFMTRMEQFAHGAAIDRNFFLDINQAEMLEAVRILDLCHKVFINSGRIRRDSCIVLSPRFGIWGQRIGGAEADIYIDGGLYDFKSRMDTGYHSQDVMQLWGYYLLHQMNAEGICGGTLDEDDLGDNKIERLCIYYSRYGVIHCCPAPKVDTALLESFADLILANVGNEHQAE